MTADAGDELTRLHAENARLIELLDTHGIAWREPQPLTPPVAAVTLTPAEKVALFRRLFHGRKDVYPVRWESKAGKSGYSPACANEWLAGVCEKPRIKCADCGHRQLMPLTDQTIYDHLVGHHTVGVYRFKQAFISTLRLGNIFYQIRRNAASCWRAVRCAKAPFSQ